MKPGEGAPANPNSNVANGGSESGVAPKRSFDRLGRKALATSIAIASMISAGCSDKNTDKESKNSYDSGKPTATDFVPDKTSSSSDAIIETDDVIVTETQKNNGDSPTIIRKAEPEQGQNCPMYNLENTEVEPAIDIDDYLLSEKPAGAPKSPNGYFDITKLCEDLGIDKSEIKILGGGDLLIGDKKEVAIRLDSGRNITYFANGKMVSNYNTETGSSLSEDSISFCVENEDGGKYEFGADIHYSPSAIGTIELMLRAKASGQTTDPLAK